MLPVPRRTLAVALAGAALAAVAPAASAAGHPAERLVVRGTSTILDGPCGPAGCPLQMSGGAFHGTTGAGAYSGDLTEEAMKGSPLGRMLGMFGGANAEVKGSGRIFIDPSGSVMVYEITTKAAVELQGNQIDFSLTRRAELSELGKVKVEIPEGVQKLLGEKPKTEDKKE